MDEGTRASDEARFWANVDKNGPIPEHCPELGPCWIWTGGCDASGYGLFYYHDETGRRRRTRAHRWLLGHLRSKPLTREVVGKEDACHHCDNPPCVRAEADGQGHLYIGTRKQNIADAVERKRIWQLKVTHCPQGHEYTYNPSGKHRRCKECEGSTQRATRRANKTHCKHGHPLEGDNVLPCKNGKRKCRICEEARIARVKAAKAASNECPNGHPYTEENTAITPKGTRSCRECKQQTARRRTRRAA